MMEREKLHEDLATSEEVREMLDEKEKVRQKWIIQQQKENLTAIDAFQAALDVVGFEPTRWSVADWTNALIYLFRSAKVKLAKTAIKGVRLGKNATKEQKIKRSKKLNS